jgi:hypothetical protein
MQLSGLAGSVACQPVGADEDVGAGCRGRDQLDELPPEEGEQALRRVRELIWLHTPIAENGTGNGVTELGDLLPG